MGGVMTFLGGIVALAFLGFLLFFELSIGSMLFVYVISALIALVLGAMLVSLRGAIGRAVGAVAGRVRPKARGLEIAKEEKLDFPKPAGPPGRVSNPMLRELMERVREKRGEPQEEMGEEEPKSEKESRFSGLLGKLGGVLKPGKRKRAEAGKELEEIKEKLAGMDELEEEMEGPEDEKIAETLEEETEGKKAPKEGKPERGPKIQRPAEAPAKEKVEPIKGEEGAGYCQICGSRENLQMHHITPLEKGGSDEEGNIIMLCGKHKKQAEYGMYSENLLRRMKEI